MRSRFGLFLVVLLSLLLVACGGGESEGAAEVEPEGPEPIEVTFTLDNDFIYKPQSEIGVEVGQQVTFVMDNESTVFEHNLVWEGESEENPFLYTAPSSTDSATRTFDSAGQFDFYCSIPGHREAGMVGNVIVR